MKNSCVWSLIQNNSVSKFWPQRQKFDLDFKIWTRVQNLTSISKFDLDFKIWPRLQNLTSISKFELESRIWPRFQNLTSISKFDLDFRIWPRFQNLTSISEFYLSLRNYHQELVRILTISASNQNSNIKPFLRNEFSKLFAFEISQILYRNTKISKY